MKEFGVIHRGCKYTSFRVILAQASRIFGGDTLAQVSLFTEFDYRK